ncbi:hypothetical protein O181_001477 [Austropuccinia psidii MF-1]|uniref:Uncharacterized protein n=1 Tax=Austropuccinia psidii MF-1 TaxID=1389203 RepID=A0A9Q3BAW4_9BASI|nr:hypothetical protein [Austropuccinia psidii MF-1]
MIPKISLTTPIASSMNVSGLKIDLGIETAQPSRNWSIPNISVTAIPPNPANTQMHVSVGPGSTPVILSKANPQSKFPHEVLLNSGQNPVASQEPVGKNKQSSLNIPSGSQIHVGHEKQDHWKKLLGMVFWREIWDQCFINVSHFDFRV